MVLKCDLNNFQRLEYYTVINTFLLTTGNVGLIDAMFCKSELGWPCDFSLFFFLIIHTHGVKIRLPASLLKIIDLRTHFVI